MNIRARIYGETGADYSPVLSAKSPKGARTGMLHSISVSREEIRRCDTRIEDRHRMAGERAQATHNGSNYDVELINVATNNLARIKYVSHNVGSIRSASPMVRRSSFAMSTTMALRSRISGWSTSRRLNINSCFVS